jgi:hypothetical protein
MPKKAISPANIPSIATSRDFYFSALQRQTLRPL